MKNKTALINSIVFQVAAIVIGFSLVALLLSISLYRESMKSAALKEVENKAVIFLSSMETSVRRMIKERDPRSISELISERSSLLEDHLNFAIVRVMVRDVEGKIIDHTRPEKKGTTHFTDDLKEVIETGGPVVKREVKTLRLLPGQPVVRVIEVIYPVTNRQKGDIQAIIKLIISVEKSFEMIRDDYGKYSRRVMSGFVLVAVLLVGGTLFFIRRRIIKPILAIENGAERVAAGELDTFLQPTGNNELSKLMYSFNEMVTGLKQRDQMQQSLEVAKEVQQNLLPQSNPSLRGFDIAGRTRYCDETGGDYYDFIYPAAAENNNLGVVIGDVSGHGISSALLMTTARAFLRQRSSLPGTITEVVGDVNRQLSRDVGESGSFMSLFYMIVNPDQMSMDWVRAGHDPAIVFDPAIGSCSELKGEGIALGVDETWSYRINDPLPLKPGQVIMVGTDGIWEARNQAGEMFGKGAVYQILQERWQESADAIAAEIFDRLDEFTAGTRLEDDVTLIILKVGGGEGSPGSVPSA
ncbi:MAG: HAMP domain-containing protein [Desulfobulbaceae bacterium]|nr:MAG: HAMP domain-containing protein [Desulfobulbaceae bacterium]